MFKALCLFRNQLEHIKPVEKELAGHVEFQYDRLWLPLTINEQKPDIVISINEHHRSIADCYERANLLSIPTLTIQDGVLEWRHLFENPVFRGNEFGVPLHHPVIADKIACIGPLWYNFIRELGNASKVELTGMPKMDIVGSNPIKINNQKRKRILILTAAKPWFYDNQKPVILEMLSDLKEFFSSHPELEAIWRVTRQLDKDLGLRNHFKRKDTVELKSLLDQCDAVISTTSTAMIESMLCGKPVARIDYFNNPALFPTVWNITHKSQIEYQVQRLLEPSPMECWLQEVFKDQVILGTTNAAKNVAFLIMKMIHLSKNREQTKLPSDICLNNIQEMMAKIPPPLSSFYPQREALNITDPEALKTKLIRTEWELNLLKMNQERASLLRLILRKLRRR